VLNLTSTNIVPFKSNIYSFDWTNKFFRESSEIKFTIKINKLILEEKISKSLKNLESFFKKYNFKYSKDSSNSLLSLTIDKDLDIPSISFDTFLNLLRDYYSINKHEEISSLDKLIISIISDIFSQIRIVADVESVLLNIIESIKRNIGRSEIVNLFDKLISENKWKEFFENESSTFPYHNVHINTWLHILRHPKNAKIELLNFLDYLYSKKNDTIFSITELPVIDPKNSIILTITLLQKKTIGDIQSFPEEVIAYWLTLSSMILRNISYALIHFNSLTLQGFEGLELSFYEYFKKKLTQFSESCLNSDLVEAYKNYESPRGKLIFNSIRGHELYTYNRGKVLEFHLKQSTAQFNSQPNKKILRKRVNRRSNKLFSFLNDVILAYYSYLTDIMVFTKASGNYKSFEEVVKRDQLLMQFNGN